MKAPGHSRKRCVYVDFLSTGAAICAALRNKTSRDAAIRRLSNVTITDIVVRDGEVAGAVGIDVPTSAPVKIKCSAVILCTGGMTKMFQRTTASNNLAGEGVGLALRSGARVIDIEFLQFYPNGHLAPRMVGLDPTTWEPTRVKLGGRLLNGLGEEFLHRYGEEDGGSYDTARDILTYRDLQGGRGRTRLAARRRLSVVPAHRRAEAEGRARSGDRDLRAQQHQSRPSSRSRFFLIAHYQMGGVEVDTDMASTLPGLYAAGEIAGGANGANRLSGNAPCPRRWCSASAPAKAPPNMPLRNKASRWDDKAAQPHLELIRKVSGRQHQRHALARAVDGRGQGADVEQGRRLPQRKPISKPRATAFTPCGRTSSTSSRSAPKPTSTPAWWSGSSCATGCSPPKLSRRAALNRQESRGAHQRDDFPKADDRFLANQRLTLEGGEIVSAFKRVSA